MASQSFSRRHFFFGSLFAGAIPAGGFGSTASLKALGYRSPNEKLNLAAIGAGGQPAADLRIAHAGVENVVALADVDWDRGKENFEHFPDAKRYKDFREMLDNRPLLGRTFRVGSGSDLARAIESYLAVPAEERRRAISAAVEANSMERVVEPFAAALRLRRHRPRAHTPTVGM